MTYSKFSHIRQCVLYVPVARHTASAQSQARAFIVTINFTGVRHGDSFKIVYYGMYEYK